jgi:outer membrane lipoprotein-sorting protein
MRTPRPMVSICAALALSAVAAIAHDATTLSDTERDGVINHFAAQQLETRTYQATLKQTVVMRGLREPLTSEGKVYFQQPDALAFIFTQPTNEYYIVNGPDIWLKKRSKPMVHRRIDPNNPAAAGDMRFLMSVFTDGGTNTHERFNVTIARADQELQVVLTPKARKPRSRDPVRIENWVDANSLELQKLRVEFEGDNAITYEFTNPQRNGPLDAAVFQPPQNGK